MKTTLRSGVATALLATVLAVPPAKATASAGASYTCDRNGGHCVTGAAASADVQRGVSGVFGAAVCTGAAPGAVQIEVTCSVGSYVSTVSAPGPVVASTVLIGTGSRTPYEACWTVSALVAGVIGPVRWISTSDCALVAV